MREVSFEGGISMEALRNFAIYVDESLVEVTMNRAYLDKRMEELKAQNPNSKVSFGVWYD